MELVGVPVQVGGRRFYVGGELPVGDAFIAWARSSPAGAVGRVWEPVSGGWFVPLHVASAVVGGLLLAWGWRIVGRRKR